MSAWSRNRSGIDLDRIWDALVAGTASEPGRAGTDELTTLRRFHALDSTPEPDAAFVARLGQQLAFAPRNQTVSMQQSAVAQPPPVRAAQPPRLLRPAARHRLMAVAATLLLLLAGASGLWLAQRGSEPEERSIPAVVVESSPETSEGTPQAGTFGLLHTTFDPATIGASVSEESTVALEYVLEIPAGETYQQNGPASGDRGVSVVVVLSETFEAVSSGPSLIYRKGDSVGTEVAANSALGLGAGDAWIASAQDLATANNTGEELGELLRFVFGVPGDGTYFEFTPSGGYPFAHDPEVPALPEGPLTLDLQRVPLEQGDTHHVEVLSDEPFLMATSGEGAIRITKDGSNRGASTTATSLGDYPPGSYTITRDLSGGGDLYLARLAGAQAPVDPQTTDAPAIETLLNATVDPAAIAAGPQADWNYSGVFPKQGLRPGQSITLDAATWGSGLTITQVLDGTIVVEAEGPVQIVPAGSSAQELVAGGSRIELTAGDAIFLDASRGAEIRNEAASDAQLLTFVVFDAPEQFFPEVPYPENLWGPLAPSVDLDLTQQFDGPVTVSFQRVTLDQDESISVEVRENDLVYFDTDDGSLVHFQQAGSSQAIPGGRVVLHDKGPGTYTLTRLQNDPVEIFLIRFRVPDSGGQA